MGWLLSDILGSNWRLPTTGPLARWILNSHDSVLLSLFLHIVAHPLVLCHVDWATLPQGSLRIISLITWWLASLKQALEEAQEKATRLLLTQPRDSQNDTQAHSVCQTSH